MLSVVFINFVWIFNSNIMVKVVGLFNSFAWSGVFEMVGVLGLVMWGLKSYFVGGAEWFGAVLGGAGVLFSEVSSMVGGGLGLKYSFWILFLFIWGFNWFSLVSYVFPVSSHLFFTVGLGLSGWLGSVLVGVVYGLWGGLMGLVPFNSPGYLVSFMVLVESVSQLIRPITLSLRLAANITAGHIMLSLVNLSLGGVVGGFVLVGLEMLVAVIQAYVFTMLVVYYYSEVV